MFNNCHTIMTDIVQCRGGSRISIEGVQIYLGGSLLYFYQYFLKIPHENEIIWLQKGVRANPLTPSKSATAVFLEIKLVSFSNTCSLICCFQSGSKHMRLCQESQMISPGPEVIKRFSSSA